MRTPVPLRVVVRPGLPSRPLILLTLVGLWLVWTAPPAEALPSSLCERAAREASAATGVPLSVLRAIALTETGRMRDGRAEPWPWATNAAGQGRWFDDRATAEAHVRALRASGVESIDIGCFQVNLRWHGQAFDSVESMFEPSANALYAARFLSDLHDEFGSWAAAAGAYHSRTPELAQRYTRRFLTYLAQIDDAAPLPAFPERERPRRGTASFGAAGPLLQPAAAPLLPTALASAGPASGAPGSLVPAGSGSGGLLVTGSGILR